MHIPGARTLFNYLFIYMTKLLLALYLSYGFTLVFRNFHWIYLGEPEQAPHLRGARRRCLYVDISDVMVVTSI